ncbi:MAG: condensation domain-containing protein, partial [Psychrosphaera sp.]|nr:condensation domain-containing protein [Psychrosphaera sp.]
MIYGFNNAYKTRESDVVLQQASFAFDVSVGEMLPVICCGGVLALPQKSVIGDPNQFAAFIDHHQVTIFGATPSLLSALHFEKMPQLRLIFSGGEALNINNVQKLFDAATIVNGYGPTEATIGATAFVLSPEMANSTALIPIGKPGPNYQTYVLDAHQQPLPIGVAGELSIGGVGLARGYLNRAELTEQQFIWITIDGKTERVYKTGDLVRWRADGNLEYLGRIDHQVKLRGYRIELGEIESRLGQHDYVKEAVVTVVEKAANKQLVAYVTLSESLDSSQVSTLLSEYLAVDLPEYMVPSGFVVVENFVLTSNGKIDRKALPEPDLSAFGGIEQTEKTQLSETEKLLCGHWSSLLGFDVSNAHTDFFAAGGHSLLATKLAFAIRRDFGIDMPLGAVFDNPMLSQQATYIDTEQRSYTLPSVTAQSADEELVLSFAQQRLWFLAQMQGSSGAYDMPAALLLDGQINEQALRQALNALVSKHQSLRMCFPSLDGKASVRINAVYDALTVTELFTATELLTKDCTETGQKEQINQWVEQQRQVGFDLSCGPLFRFSLLKLQHQSVLVFNMHHIISDGWSISVLVNDLNDFYHSCNTGAQPQPQLQPQLLQAEVQYSDFAHWQRQWLQGEAKQQLLNYWAEQLNDAPQLLQLPTDFARPTVMDYPGQCLQSKIGQALADSVKQLSQQHGTTAFMTLLAVFNVLLARYSDQDGVVVGTPVANWTHHQTADMIGLFVNTLVMRTQINSGDSFAELLKQVRQTTLAAYAHQDIPFEMLVDELKPQRSLSHSPLFQVMFAFQNAESQTLKFDGVDISSWQSGSSAFKAKFELTLSITEHPDGLVLDWEYCTELFKASTIERMSQHFDVLLSAIVNNPQLPLDGFEILTQAEQGLIRHWNDTHMDYPTQWSVAQAFENQVAQTPANIALVFAGTGVQVDQLSYRQLNEKANQLAHYLIAAGVCAESLVGICIDRSLEMVISILAVFKAGGGYLPLDPDYPATRLSYLLQDSGCKVLLSKTHLIENIPQSKARIMDVQGFGRQKGQTEVYRGREISINLLRKVQLQIAVND